MFSKRTNRNSRPKRQRAGFSLVELMVVMVIIGLLAGVISLSVNSYLVRGKQGVAKLEIAKLSEAINSFYVAHDRYPTTQEGLAVLAQRTEKAVEGFIPRIKDDPWGNEYDYISPARSGPFEIVCYGADKREGGTGADTDIVSTELGDDR